MSNLTIAVDDDTVRQARIRALQEGTSLSAKVREFLAAYAQGAPRRTAHDVTADLMRMMEAVRAEAQPGPLPEGERAFSREETYQGDLRKNG
jgi:plasmid stability protein